MSQDECGKCGRPAQAGDCYGCVVDRLLDRLIIMAEWPDGCSMESLRAYARAVFERATLP